MEKDMLTVIAKLATGQASLIKGYYSVTYQPNDGHMMVTILPFKQVIDIISTISYENQYEKAM